MTTQMIADMKSVISNGPSATTKANAIAAAGPIMDYAGVCNEALLKMEETEEVLAKVITNTAAGDSANTTLLDGVQALLQGTSGPSTQALTDMKSVISNGPGATTQANCIAAAGVIMDYLGLCRQILTSLSELVPLLTYVKTNTDNGTDGTNRTLILGILAALA